MLYPRYSQESLVKSFPGVFTDHSQKILVSSKRRTVLPLLFFLPSPSAACLDPDDAPLHYYFIGRMLGKVIPCLQNHRIHSNFNPAVNENLFLKGSIKLLLQSSQRQCMRTCWSSFLLLHSSSQSCLVRDTLFLPNSDDNAFITGQTLDPDHLCSLDPQLYKQLFSMKTDEVDVEVSVLQ